jgi:hypothetical protein
MEGSGSVQINFRIRMQIQEAQKQTHPTDPDTDHWFKDTNFENDKIWPSIKSPKHMKLLLINIWHDGKNRSISEEFVRKYSITNCEPCMRGN